MSCFYRLVRICSQSFALQAAITWADLTKVAIRAIADRSHKGFCGATFTSTLEYFYVQIRHILV